MKSIITILIIFISCTDHAPTPTDVGVKKDSVVVVDTVAKVFKVSSREVLAAVQENILYDPVIRKTFDSMVAFKMADIQKVDMTTMRKDIRFIVGENERLNAEIIILQDSLNKFHSVWFNPNDFDAVKGQNTDSVSLKKL